MPKAAFGESMTNRFQPESGIWTGWSVLFLECAVLRVQGEAQRRGMTIPLQELQRNVLQKLHDSSCSELPRRERRVSRKSLWIVVLN
jgi:hypothetical protein